MITPGEVTLNEAGFREWLQGLFPHRPVGLAQSCGLCPIASYITSLTGNGYIEVDQREFWIGGAKMGDIPEWASFFIERVDALPAGTEITANDALQALNWSTGDCLDYIKDR